MSKQVLMPYGKFEKWTACGNDFILTSSDIPELPTDVDPPQSPYREPRPPKRHAVQRVCDRHFGVGGDGLIFITESDVADACMTIINYDGTRAEMCGNGIRCVGQYLSRVLGRDKVTVDTDIGIKELLITGVDVHVDMSPVILMWTRPMTLPNIGPEVLDPTAPPRVYDATHVDVGNPHCVLLVSDYEEWEIDRYGRMIQDLDATFPVGTNVEFVKHVGRDRVRMRVWERGVGRTLACGTGAVASAYVAFKRGIVGSVVTVELEGGEVEIRITEYPEDENGKKKPDKVVMVGMAERVFDGEFRSDVLEGKDPHPPEYLNPDGTYTTTPPSKV